MNAAEAALLAGSTKAKAVIPMHYDLFVFKCQCLDLSNFHFIKNRADPMEFARQAGRLKLPCRIIIPELMETNIGGYRFVFVKIITDEGFYGLGEITLDGRLTTVIKAIDHLKPLLIGRSPLDTEHIWQDIYRGTFWRGGPVLLTALSGVDIALWDIKGKAFNVPVYDLIGGKARKKILVYGHAGGKTKEELAENSLKRIEQGYRVIRICPSDVDVINGVFELGPAIRRSVKFFSHLRKVVGEDIDIIYEVHTRLSPANAIELCNAIAEFRPMFVEDPIRTESPEAFELLRAHTNVHLATGEQLGAKWDFRTLIEKDLIDYIRADVCHCGGITETLKIAAMAETHYQEIALHHAS
jgi:galactonate dehydratase